MSFDAALTPAPSSAAPPRASVYAPVHDFAGKLRQPGLLPRVTAYVAWRRAVLEARARGGAPPPMPDWAPLSINLDLTTACNYACDHCVDWDILNSGVNHEDGALRESLRVMAERGLKSVILIGGGEPTVYPGFAGMVRHLKSLGLQVAIVSNGGRNERIHAAADVLGREDWVRLSLDAGTDATFQAMHRPKKPVTLADICAWVPRIKARCPKTPVGFSFVIVWPGAQREPGAPVHENIDEIPLAARLARESGFDYVSFKPFLVRRPDGSEVMDPALDDVLRRIRARVDEAKALASPAFRVVESTNLRVLEGGTWRDLTRQPKTCHMQALRHVLTPTGLWNCPSHRGAAKALVAGRDAYASPEAALATARAVEGILDRFDAERECREVTCLYHGANWWIERAVAGDGIGPQDALPEREDWFL